MIRATTPTHRFTVPFDPSEMKELLLSYAQHGRVVLERRKGELSFSTEEGEYLLSHRLTQAETSRFRAEEPVLIQLRVLSQAGDALASDPVTIRVEDVLNDEVLV